MTLAVSTTTLFAFLLVLARVCGLIAFLPIPGFRNTPVVVRVVLALSITFALFPVWPSLINGAPSVGELVQWSFREAGYGLVTGLAVSLLTEGFQIAAQIAGLQAGYGYASTIDPNSEADSTVLQVVASLTTAICSSLPDWTISLSASSLQAVSNTPPAPGRDPRPVLRTELCTWAGRCFPRVCA